jgi:raffinose/stachyose/melibiose transport system substrate-binding protein
MNNHRYRIASIGLLLGLTVSLVLLAGIHTQASAGIQTAGQADGISPVTTKKITLTVWDVLYFPKQHGIGPVLQKVDQMFMHKYPNITIKHVGIPYAAQSARIQTAVATKRGPDILMASPNAQWNRGFWPLAWAVDNLMTPSQRSSILRLKIYRMWYPSLRYLGFGTFQYFWLYNKAFFRQAHLDPNRPPKTWSALLHACDSLRAAGITPIGAAWKDGYYADWLYTNGLTDQHLSAQDSTKVMTGRTGWNDPIFREALGYFQQLKDHKCFDDAAIGKDLFTYVNQDFRAKKAAMIYWWISDPAYSGSGQSYDQALGRGNFR